MSTWNAGDLVTKVLAAIDETEDAARAATPGPWAPEGDDPTDDEVYSGLDDEGWFGAIVAYTRDRQVPNMTHIALHDPVAVLRHCAADRRRLERHTPIPDHGRMSEDWIDDCPVGDGCGHDERPPVCRTCRDEVGDPLEAPCPDLLDLADSYNLAPASRIEGIDLSAVVAEAGDRIQADLDQAARERLADLPDATLTIEGYFGPPREHVDSADCWCNPVGPTYIHRAPTA